MCCRSQDRCREASRRRSTIRAPALSRSAAWLHLADYQAALQQVVYSSTNPTPFTGRSRHHGHRQRWRLGQQRRDHLHARRRRAGRRSTRAQSRRRQLDGRRRGLPDDIYRRRRRRPHRGYRLLITDADDTDISSATVTLTNPETADVLVFNGAPPAGTRPPTMPALTCSRSRAPRRSPPTRRRCSRSRSTIRARPRARPASSTWS